MSTIIVAITLILIIVIICVILISIHNKQREKTALELVNRFNKLGREKNFSFSEKELIADFVIGIDEVRKKILVLKKTSNTYNSSAYDLQDIGICFTNKIYKTVNTGTARKERYEKHLDKILLVLDDMNKSESLQICFYDAVTNSLPEIPDLERKADEWRLIISKAIDNKVRVSSLLTGTQ